MLTSLTVSNFKLIKHLEIQLERGLTVITGETGAGKSIIVSALSTLLGGKPDREMFVDPEKPIIINGSFSLDQLLQLEQLLADAGFSLDGDDLFLKRIITLRNGRLQNRVFINDQPAAANTLNWLGAELVEIASQHEQQALLRPQEHLAFLDLFGNLTALRQPYEHAYASLQQTRKELQAWQQQEREGNQEADYLTHQLQELEQAQLTAGEEEELGTQQQRYQQREQLLTLATGIEQLLYSGNQSLIDGCYQLSDLLRKLASCDSSVAASEQQLLPVLELFHDLRSTISNYLETLDIDPQLIEETHMRLAEIERLKRKFRCSFDELMSLKEEFRQKLAAWETRGERHQQLVGICNKQEQEVEHLGEQLSQARLEQAGKLEAAVMEHLADLRMNHARFQVALTTESLGPRGKDLVTFMISTNPGEPLAPLHQVISGGELSRFMLALKTAAASRYLIPTLLFDEADSGIGGASADAVGQKMAGIARNHQVLAITHLPQVAAWGDHHLTIRKRVDNGRTTIALECLDEVGNDARIDELARMGAGQEVSTISRDHARELILQAENKKQIAANNLSCGAP
ncbi:MAG: DNA repair protein RecN [Deltaproteobacteria bacterium]|nr:DNA repair protein RecN [Candidatus Anaeroferrophillus wilburensis]MBN2889667.1 DNA repair protein RecN [Deltaproteobacteria bacterium]